MLMRLLEWWRATPDQPETAKATVAPPSLDPKRSPSIPPSAPTQIVYHPGLVAELKSEHAALLDVYGALGEAIRQNRWGEVPKFLGTLRSMLIDHLLKERIQLYNYLQRGFLADDPDAQTLFRHFKVEMGTIGKAAFDFVDRHLLPGALAEPAARAVFHQEYTAIGEVLVDRIRREEAQLYPMYQPQVAEPP